MSDDECYVTDVSIYTDGTAIAKDADGNEVDSCTDFILAVAGELLNHCDENTRWTIIKDKVCKCRADFSRYLKMETEKRLYRAILDHSIFEDYGITLDEIKAAYAKEMARAGN